MKNVNYSFSSRDGVIVMNTRKVAAEYRLTKWAGVIQERKNSGKSIKDFCLDTGISMHSNFYYQKKLRMVACEELVKGNETAELVPAGWMQLAAEKQNRTTAIDIEIGCCHINVSKETDLNCNVPDVEVAMIKLSEKPVYMLRTNRLRKQINGLMTIVKKFSP